jgi:hypothetical protein
MCFPWLQPILAKRVLPCLISEQALLRCLIGEECYDSSILIYVRELERLTKISESPTYRLARSKKVGNQQQTRLNWL